MAIALGLRNVAVSVDGPMWEWIKMRVKDQVEKSAKGQQNLLIQAISKLGKLRQIKEKLVLEVVGWEEVPLVRCTKGELGCRGK